MAGGYYLPKGRRIYRVWFPWKGKKFFINRYLDGTPIYHEGQAKRILEKIRGEVDQGIFDPEIWGKTKSLIFQNAWRQYQEQRSVGRERMASRELIFDRYLLSYFKDKNLKEIEEHDINDWWSGVLIHGFSPAYNRLIRATLRAFLNFHRITRIKTLAFPVVRVPRKSIPWLTEIEQETILKYIPPQHQGIIRFMMTYGCRPSEACNLRKSDIDWQKRTFTFRERKTLEDCTLPILPEIETILRAPRKVESLEYAFCTALGNPYLRQTLDKVWSQANRQANKNHGLKIVCLKNGTRHSKASQLRSRGESLGVIARILGNSEKVIEQAYGRVSVEKVGEVLKMRKVENGNN